MNFAGFRYLMPTVLNTWTHSLTRNLPSILKSRLIPTVSPAIQSACRFRSTQTSPVTHTNTESETDRPQSENDVVSPTFVNRNPRNLEFMGLARKTKGWRFQFPSPCFYHQVVVEHSLRNTEARVEHRSGETVISASTREYGIARHLFSLRDVSASANIGRVLAQRCRECGITNMVMRPVEHGEKSSRIQAFQEALEAGGITLSEPEEVIPSYVPGINYEDEEAMKELDKRRKRVMKLGRWSSRFRKLNTMRRKSNKHLRLR